MWTTTRRNSPGFTLVEALLSLVILALMASAMTGLYFSGMQTLDTQGDTMLLDSALRSKMEFLLAQNFDQLASGSAGLTVNGQSYTLTWTVAHVDLDADAAPEPTAKQITVTVAERSLASLVVDNLGTLVKIP